MAVYPTISLQPSQTYNVEVKKLQSYLVSQGYMTQTEMSTGPGYYGSKTKAAVTKLQEAKGVDTAGFAGYWGPKTIAALTALPREELGRIDPETGLFVARKEPLPLAPKPGEPEFIGPIQTVPRPGEPGFIGPVRDIITYTMVSGDTLSAIASRFGTTVDVLMAANPQITDRDVIEAGNILNIPSLAERLGGAGAVLDQVTRIIDTTGPPTPGGVGYDEEVVGVTTGADTIIDQTTYSTEDLTSKIKLSDILPDLAGAGTTAGNLNISSGIAGIIALLSTTSETDTEYADINAKINTLLSTIEEEGTGFEAALEEYKVPETQKQLEELNLDIARIQGEIGAYDVETKEGFAGITAQTIPGNVLVGQAASYQRQRDAGRAGKASELAANAALQQAYIQNLTIATSLAEASVTYKWQGITNTLTALQIQLDLAKDIMDKADAKQLGIISILVQDQLDQVNTQKRKESEINNFLITAAINGAPLSLINSAKTSGDPVAAASILSRYLREAVEIETETKLIDGRLVTYNTKTGEIITEAKPAVVTEEEIRGYDSVINIAEGQLVILDRIIANEAGLNTAVYAGKFRYSWVTGARRWWTKQTGEFQSFTADVDTLASRDVLDTLVELKARGGTLGALSEKELKMLEDASSNFGSWRKTKTDKAGNITTVQYDINPATFMTALHTLRDELAGTIKDAESSRVTAQTTIETVPTEGWDW